MDQSAKVEAAQTFNPFRIFDRTVERRFTIQPREYSKYTDEQLHEQIVCQLRVFLIANALWYLAKDVCSFLGITPDHASRSINSIESGYVRQENITLEMTPINGVNSKRTSQYTGNVYLLNEFGIYALIQKSKTTYAQEFKKWLNEEVLPTIRATGSYTASASVRAELEDINANLEQESLGASLMTEDDKRREFEEILREKDQVIEEQKVAIEQKSTTLDEMMSLMRDMKDSIQMLHVDNRQMRADIQSLRTSLDLVIVDRVAKPADEQRHSVFIIYETGVNDIVNKEYPYCILKCQKRLVPSNEKRIKKKYVDARRIFFMENPSAEGLFQAFKEKARDIHVRLNRTSFYIEEESSINDVLTTIRRIEHRRMTVSPEDPED